jgi:hypothetical protein
MADLQSQAQLVPYLQSGEVQWWYYANNQLNDWSDRGMPYYDTYTQQQFEAKYGVPMQNITSNNPQNLPQYTNETGFLPTILGAYTAAIRSALQAKYPNCRYEVLYPNDTNATPLNQLVNFPADDWTPQNLTSLKTESFQFTMSYNLPEAAQSIAVSEDKGFPTEQRAHLIGIMDAAWPWMKEANIAQVSQLEAIVLFALDQYCLIGYPQPPFPEYARSKRQG